MAISTVKDGLESAWPRSCGRASHERHKPDRLGDGKAPGPLADADAEPEPAGRPWWAAELLPGTAGATGLVPTDADRSDEPVVLALTGAG